MSKVISKNKPPRVVIAMSGGVDSSVAAYLLKKQGYDVIGIFLKLWSPPCYSSCGAKKQNLCCDDKAMGIARQIANSLEIPFYVYKVDTFFKKEIVDNFVSEYESGRTPNPCVRCNRYIKFGYLWQKARELNADFLATGHYIRIKNQESRIKGVGTSQIIRSKDINKDQTYFLSTIGSKVLPHLVFPVGDMNKKEVREIAKRANLPVYNKKDSMGVCFIPDGNAEAFLSFYAKKLKKKGNIVDKQGNVLGKHNGLLGYTIGQKIGDDLMAAAYAKKNGLAGSRDMPRLYVIGIDVSKNQLIIGENYDCFSKEMLIIDWRQVSADHKLKSVKAYDYLVQIRGGHRPESARVKEIKKNGVLLEFKKPVRAITSGQTAAVYKKDVLIGGGIIK